MTKCRELIHIQRNICWSFGLRVRIVQVQSKVNLKYDAWHKEVVSKFGNMLGTEMIDFHGQVSKVCNSDMPFLFCYEMCSYQSVAIIGLAVHNVMKFDCCFV